jgi:integrase
MAREPGYCLHRPTGQAYVNLGGKVIYLGEHGTDESRERYNRVKAEWLVNRHSEKFQPKQSNGPTMAALGDAYLDHAEVYYAGSTEYANLKLALLPVSELFALMPAKDFGILQYRACRDWWLRDPKRSRQYVNKQMKRLLRILKWSVGEGLIPPSIHQACQCVAPLKAGRTEAPESEPVKPVPEADVTKTIAKCTTVVADMIRFQQLVGCRPGELVTITPAMVNRSSEVWTITLAKHKTAYRGKQRTIYVGPKAQKILTKYLLRSEDAACFSPVESEKERRQKKHDERVTPLSCGNRPGSNRIARKPRKAPGEAFSTGTYARSVRSACLRAKVTPWSPNQLRHNAATSIRKEFGLEAAQVILGHSELGVTQVYAERDVAKAIAVAKQVG